MFLQRTGWTSSNKIPGVTHPASKMQATYVLYVNTFDDIDIIITLICKAVHNSNVYVGGGVFSGRKLEYREEIHVSEWLTTIPYYIQTLSIIGIELGSLL